MSVKLIEGDLWKIDARIWVEGTEYRQREEFKGGKKAAADRENQIKADLKKTAAKKDKYRSLTIQTFAEALEYYRLSIGDEHLVSLSSFKKMYADLGGVPLHEIKVRFKSYWLNLRKSISRQTGEHLAPSTVNHYTVMAKAAFNLCVKDGLLEINPLAHIPILKVTPRDVSLSEVDRQRLLNVIDREAPHLAAIISFALAVPSRKSELVQLKRDDLDLMNNAIRIRHANAKGDNGSWKPIPPDMVEYFRSIPAESEYLFYRIDKKKPVCLGNFKRSYNRCCKIAGLTDFHFHDTRHLAATDLLNAGNPEQVVCQIAGWKSGNMIKKYYHKDGLRAVQDVVFVNHKPDTTKEKPDTFTGHFGVAV